MPTTAERPKPFLLPQYCKGCGRCIEACAKHCIEMGTEINPETGLVPVVLHLEDCTACGLCMTPAPSPTASRRSPAATSSSRIPRSSSGRGTTAPEPPRPIPDERLPLPPTQPLVIKGTYASAIGALLAGCRHFFGYPITPSTEGAELMAKLLPQARRRLPAGGQRGRDRQHDVRLRRRRAAARMTFTSSPGFSLMLEGISYMIGAEVPGVFVNVMRGGPGLGNIAPEQSDIKLACRGLGHGNTHAHRARAVDAAGDARPHDAGLRAVLQVPQPGRRPRRRLPRPDDRPGRPADARWSSRACPRGRCSGDRAHRRNLISLDPPRRGRPRGAQPST